MTMKCTTCSENLLAEDRFTKFKCPECLEVEIARCENCRKKSNSYVCSKCGFEGP